MPDIDFSSPTHLPQSTGCRYGLYVFHAPVNRGHRIRQNPDTARASRVPDAVTSVHPHSPTPSSYGSQTPTFLTFKPSAALMLELTPFPSIFPVETEENFIDQLSDCVPALRYCALTCRAWLPRSRFHLLRSVRIKSEKHLEAFSDMLDKYPTRRSWITSVTMAPTAKGSNPRRLLETFPFALLANFRNLRRWEINQASVRKVARRATLFFHNTTLTRLRCSSLEELHLSSIQLGSHAELVRVLVAFAGLSSLKCTNVTFSQAGTAGQDSLKVTARRTLAKLSTLAVSSARPPIRGTFYIAYLRPRELTMRVDVGYGAGGGHSVVRGNAKYLSEPRHLSYQGRRVGCS